jgi:predicted ArsR family transcriptional regulator
MTAKTVGNELLVFQHLFTNVDWWDAGSISRALGIHRNSVKRILYRLEESGMVSGRAMKNKKTGHWVRHYRLKQ